MVKKKHINDEPCDKEVVNIDVGDLDENEFENLYVHQIYDNISTHFSHTRYGCWKNVVKVINSVDKNSVILDVGCGNGKYLNTRDDCYFLGIDVCSSLLQICNERGKNNLILSNNLRLPIRDNVSDLTLSIAVIHHMSTLSRRLDAIRELIRCTKSKGKILIYVWAFEQDKNYIGYREFSSQDVLVPWNLQSVYSNTCKSNTSPNRAKTYFSYEIKEDHGDDDGEQEVTHDELELPEPVNTVTTSLSPKKDLNFKRYYHVFKKDEIVDICNHFKGSVESTIYTDCNNWVIEMCKL